MQLTQAIAELQRRVGSPRITNLVYLRFPVTYVPVDPARQVAEALGVKPISMLDLLVERFGDRWERLVAEACPACPERSRGERSRREQAARLGPVTAILAQDLVTQVKAQSCAVVCDTEVLYAFPDLNPTALLYPLSDRRVIVVSVKASPVATGLRLLDDGPIYPVDNCTVLEIEELAT